MKKNITRIISTILAVTMCSVTSFAHSGRTDANGGHRDNKNKSGLGSYHYHCGGYPPHLHPNGVCPYGRSSSSTSTKTSTSGTSSSYSTSNKTNTSLSKAYSGYTSSASYVPATTNNSYSASAYTNTNKPILKKVYLSCYHGEVNGEPIYLYNIEGDSRYYIIAEALEDYGFDVKWVEEWNTLYITKNNKAPKHHTLPTSHETLYLGAYKNSDYALRLLGNNFNYEAESYSLGGSMLVPISELKCYNIT